ncbi:hypothetical protein EJ05DRAFT_471493 [Pseudovirgaria hyperparasitica]|uniref:Uncharacterized protein n=1 Tax=Pseudovirgaria hyperparasitica TaxID=470096 RepID=A0A6A6WJQ8_9PEZI|nr:uncharacterized protein EJ05DRAFT_471493 [Pseudovirgaria hyperparasitica]KAF2762480.1 hypothetical protein EJ05DRAFT_471493 [Pseudovirgaria hyperparasitica]
MMRSAVVMMRSTVNNNHHHHDIPRILQQSSHRLRLNRQKTKKMYFPQNQKHRPSLPYYPAHPLLSLLSSPIHLLSHTSPFTHLPSTPPFLPSYTPQSHPLNRNRPTNLIPRINRQGQHPVQERISKSTHAQVSYASPLRVMRDKTHTSSPSPSHSNSTADSRASTQSVTCVSLLRSHPAYAARSSRTSK